MQMVDIRRIVLPFVILGVSLGAAQMMYMSREVPEMKPERPKPLLVTTKEAVPVNLTYQIDSQGTVLPKLNSSLVTEVSGRVLEVADQFVAGGFFNQGDVMVKIDPSDYETAVKTAEANLARAKASLQEEKARAKVAEEEWNSFAKGDAPELYLRKPQLARELANVRSAQASLEVAQRDLRRTVIRAPFNAMVKQKSTEIGQFVNRGAMLGSLYGTDIAEIRLPLADDELAYIDMPRPNSDQKVAVTLSAEVAGQLAQWQGFIVRSEGVVDERSRVTYAVVELADPYGLRSADSVPLSYGRFVRAQINGRSVENIVVLPRVNLTRDNQVLVMVEKKVNLRNVEIDRLDEDKVYIRSGLAAGEQYITSVVPNAMNGMAVRTTDDPVIESEDNPEVDAIVKAGN